MGKPLNPQRVQLLPFWELVSASYEANKAARHSLREVLRDQLSATAKSDRTNSSISKPAACHPDSSEVINPLMTDQKKTEINAFGRLGTLPWKLGRVRRLCLLVEVHVEHNRNRASVMVHVAPRLTPKGECFHINFVSVLVDVFTAGARQLSDASTEHAMHLQGTRHI